MQIVLKGVSAPRSSAGRNFRYIEGTEIPAYDPLAFFMLDGGVEGAAHPPNYANAVGGSAGLVYGDRLAPTRIPAGIRIDSTDGFLLDTGVSARRRSFVTASLMRIYPRPAGNTSSYFLLQHTANDPAATIPLDRTATVSSGGYPSIGFGWIVGANSGRLNGWSSLFSPTTGTGPLHNLPTNLGQQDAYIAMALAVDGQTGQFKAHTLQASLDRSDSVRGDTRVRDYFDTNLASRGGNFLFGLNPSGARLPTGPVGEMVCCGVFDGYHDDATVREILVGMAKLGVARGLTVAGYTP